MCSSDLFACFLSCVNTSRINYQFFTIFSKSQSILSDSFIVRSTSDKGYICTNFCQFCSKNSKMDGDGVIGMSNLVAIPMRGAAGDSALSRKRGWHEKMVDEHKRKASKGEQISIRN